ncbi:MAG: type II toxin-antitoxin system PemK/MazF family toxin [Acidobacteria bacterium]|nr:type II toxin-antitoxin system PemK/MazF family toxin [Acidobacteriota bacterium]
MGGFVKGTVVIFPFPFSDLSDTKRRPCLIISRLDGDDAMLCMITSQTVYDSDSVELTNGDFETGKMNYSPSNIRPNRIFTADTNEILYMIGKLKEEKMKGVTDKLIEIFSR